MFRVNSTYRIARVLGRRETPSARLAFVLLLIVCWTIVFSTAAVQTAVVLLTLTIALQMMGSERPPFRRTPLDVPYAVFVLARVISVPLSVDPVRSLEAIPHEFFYYVVFFLVTQTFDHENPGEGRFILFSVIGAGVAAAMYGTILVLAGVEVRATSTTAGSYTLGGYLCTVFPLAFLAPQDGRSGLLKRVYPVFAGMIALGIVFTLNRLHWAGMVLALLLVGVLFRRRLLLAFFVGFSTLVLMFPAIQKRLGELLDLSQSMSGRDVLWRGALALLDRHPVFGFGPRTFELIFPFFAAMPVRGVGSWHNDYLQVYMESGLIGLFAFLWLIAAVYRQAWQFLRVPSPGRDRRVVIALLLSLTVVFLVGGAFDTLVGILFRILLAIFAVMSATEGVGRKEGVAEP